MSKRLIPESFHPGEYIKEEAEARGWSIEQLANKLKYRRDRLRNVINGYCIVSPVLADKLGRVFGTGAEVWLNLQAERKKRKP